MRYIPIILFTLMTLTGWSQVKLTQVEKDSIKFRLPVAHRVVPGQSGYFLKYMNVPSLFDSLGISLEDSINGTTNRVAKFTSQYSVGNSQIYTVGDSLVGINENNPQYHLDVTGKFRVSNRTGGTVATGAGFTADGQLVNYQLQDSLNTKIKGTGTATQLAYFNGANSITSNSFLHFDQTNQRLGIGTTVPTQRLTVSGGDASINSLTFGRGPGNLISNVTLGYLALNVNTSGNQIVAIGRNVLLTNTTGGQLTAVGYQAGRNNTIGVLNTYYGYNAGYANLESSEITAIGANALYLNTGRGCVALGNNSGFNNNARNNKLYIENSDTTSPLIGGDFAVNRVGINKHIDSLNSTLHVGGSITIDSLKGSGERIIVADSTGKLKTTTVVATALSTPNTYITSGTQITITGAGTSGDPYVINNALPERTRVKDSNTIDLERITLDTITATVIAGSIGATELASSGVSAGTYNFATVTLDQDGRVIDASSGTPNAGTVTSITTTDGITGGPITTTGTLGLTGQALAIHNHAFNGLLVRTGSGTFSSRQLMSGAGISITNGNGISGDPTISNTGVLTFNGNTGAVTGVTGVTASSPLASSGGTAPNISMTQSGTSTNGWLSSTDWNTFNSKEPAITAGSTAQYWRGDKTWQTLNTTVVPEGTNQYFTNARARSAISLTTTGTSGAATYNSSTGVLNIPQYAGLGSFSATSPLIYNGAGNFSIQNATTSQSGALTSTDWNTFNNKVGGTGINTRIPYWTGTNTQSSTPYYYDNILGALVIPTGQSVYFPGTSTIIDKNNSGGAANEILSRATSGGGLDWIAIPDNSSINELQTISTNTSPGNITLSGGGGTLNLNVNDADASNTNEGYIGVTAGGASSSVIQGYNSSGTATGVGLTINAGSGLSITESPNTNGGSITLSATGGSGTVTSVGLSEGSGITITGTNPITSSGSMTIARKVEAGQLSLSSISVPSTETVINFTNEDTESNIDTDAANNRILVSTSGIYQINFSGYIVPIVSGVDRTVVLTLRKDGSEINSQILKATYGSTNGNAFSMSEVINLSFSDIIDATFYYSTGGSGSSITLYNARLSVHKL